jgi:hypothetical protein
MQQKSIQEKENLFLSEFGEFLDNSVNAGLITNDAADDIKFLCSDFIKYGSQSENVFVMESSFDDSDSLDDTDY